MSMQDKVAAVDVSSETDVETGIAALAARSGGSVVSHGWFMQ